MLKTLTWIAISILFITPNINSKHSINKYLCECILDDSSVLYIYDTINGNMIDSIQNDYQNEEFFSVSITEFSEDWSKVSASSISEQYHGWVKLKTFTLYTYSANYASAITIYHPNNKSQITFTTDEYIVDKMTVLDCEAGWLLVTFEHKGETIIGWIKEKDTCSNPYTTCN